ncbi:MAG: hypothetical protein AAF479_05970, partial [Pseudomonadota bacterium]
MTVLYNGDGRIAAGGLYAGTGANGSVTADGETSSLPTLQIGTNFTGGAVSLAEGTLTLTGGTNLTFEYQGAGTPPGGFGVNAVVANAGGGGSANGYLYVQGGSTIAFNNAAEEQMNGSLYGAYNNLTIGRGAGANGIVEVSDAGSSLTASGGAARITVGRDAGAGSVDVTDGGVLGTFNLTAGRDGGRGIVSVSGAGSEIRLGFNYGTYGAQSNGDNGFSNFGRGFNGNALAVIDDGGALRVQNNDGVTDGTFLRFGRDEDSSGYMAVSGLGSTLSLTQVGALDVYTFSDHSLNLGQGGRGMLAVEHSAEVNVLGDGAKIILARGRQNSDDTLESQLAIRSGGKVLVDSGMYASPFDLGAQVVIGNSADLSGKITVDGSGSSLRIESQNPGLTNGATLQVANEGNGRLEVTNGGYVGLNKGTAGAGGLYIANSSGPSSATGYALVSGTNSTLRLSSIGMNPGDGDRIQVGTGSNKTGTLVVRDGGLVDNMGGFALTQIGGTGLGGSGTLIVEGAGSIFQNNANMYVGGSTGSNMGRLEVGDGGKVYASNLYVNETGTLDLAGSVYGDVNVSGTLRVGGDNAVGAGFISGNLDTGPSGEIRLEVFGTQAGQFDTLTVGDGGLGSAANITIDLSGLASAVDGTRIKLIEVETLTGDTPPIDFDLIAPISTPAGVIAGTYVAAGGQALYLDIGIGAPMSDTVGIVGTALSVAEGEAGENNEVTVTFRREGDLNVSMDVFVNLNFTGAADLTDLDTMGAVSTTVVFNAGESEATLNLGIAGDDDFEGDEAFSVSISGATKSDFTAVSVLNNETTVVIIDDDLAPDLQTSGSVTGGGDFNFRPIDPSTSFLRLDSTDAPVGNAVALDLSVNDLEFNAGELMSSRVVGSFFFDVYGGVTSGLTGVFSTSSTILGGGSQYRLPDALPVPNFAYGVYTPPSIVDGYIRDFDGDFSFGGTAEVPVGANYLFVQADDVYFNDNTPNGNFGLALYTPLTIGNAATGEATAVSQNFNDAALWLGLNGGQGKLTLRDTNWNMTSGTEIGFGGGAGRLLVQDGSHISIADPVTYGAATLPGFEVGTESGSGYVNISGGSTLMVDSSYTYIGVGNFYGGYRNVVVGDARGLGTLTVEGAGSSVTATGIGNRIRIGDNFGDGVLQVRDGATVETLTLQTGRNAGTGIVNITGEGSTVRVSAANGTYGQNYAQYAGSARFGRDGGDGSLRISDGGALIVENVDGLTDNPFFEIARELGDRGNAELIGQGSKIQVIQHGLSDQASGGSGLRVGRAGQGELTLTQGASVEILGDDADIMVAEGRNGMGSSDASELNVLSGSSVLIDSGVYGDGRLDIGLGPNTNGAVLVDGMDSSLTVTTSSVTAGDYSSAEIHVGVQGTGRLTVSNDGAVYARELEVGRSTTGRGYVYVNSGGKLVADMPDDPDFVADPDNNGAGYRGIRIGAVNGSYGRLDVDGYGSTVTSSGGAALVRVGRGEGAYGYMNLSN